MKSVAEQMELIRRGAEQVVPEAELADANALLQTVEDAFRLGCLAATCDRAAVRPLAPLFAVGRADRGD